MTTRKIEITRYRADGQKFTTVDTLGERDVYEYLYLHEFDGRNVSVLKKLDGSTVYKLQSTLSEGVDTLVVRELPDTERDTEATLCADINAQKRLSRSHHQLLEALKGVIRVADRATVEFDAARAAIKYADGLNATPTEQQAEDVDAAPYGHEVTLGDIYESIAEQLAAARTKALSGEHAEALGLMQAAALEFARYRPELEKYDGYAALKHAFDVTQTQLSGEDKSDDNR